MPLPPIFLAFFLDVARYACGKTARNMNGNCTKNG